MSSDNDKLEHHIHYNIRKETYNVARLQRVSLEKKEKIVLAPMAGK